MKWKLKKLIPQKRHIKLKKAAEVLFIIVVVFVAFTLIGINVNQLLTSTGQYHVEYEGTIINKSITGKESEFGSYMSRKLHIRDQNGLEFYVVVDSSLYERAQVGMWIKSNKDGKELLWKNSQE